jgi:hypothetical protein
VGAVLLMGGEPPLSFLITLHSHILEKKNAFIENFDTIISGASGALILIFSKNLFVGDSSQRSGSPLFYS